MLYRRQDAAEFFAGSGVDITRLTGGFDYVAVDEHGERAVWTLIPPVVDSHMAESFLEALRVNHESGNTNVGNERNRLNRNSCCPRGETCVTPRSGGSGSGSHNAA